MDGNPLSFTWSFLSRPATSSASLSDPAAVKPTFNVDAAGTYVLGLIVNDGVLDSPSDTVTITTDNSPPVANAGPNQTVFVAQTVTMDGSQSSDVDGNPLAFFSSIVIAPPVVWPCFQILQPSTRRSWWTHREPIFSN